MFVGIVAGHKECKQNRDEQHKSHRFQRHSQALAVVSIGFESNGFYEGETGLPKIFFMENSSSTKIDDAQI